MFADGPWVYANVREYGASQFERCWAARRRRDRSASRYAVCGGEPAWPSGLCVECHGLFVSAVWWGRLTRRNAA